MEFNKEVPVLDKGMVKLIDVYGSDQRIVDAARTSYQKGTKQLRDDEALINYLVRNDHTSPIEQCEVTFYMKLPLFVMGQIVRHRTASLNQVSARYSVMQDEFYIPEKWRLQSKSNKQGSEAEELPWENNVMYSTMLQEVCKSNYQTYTYLVEQGVAREMARMVLPQNLYTEVYWKIDLRNLFHFLKLRKDPHAQFEVREYAYAMEWLAKNHFPLAFDAFDKYIDRSIKLSVMERNVLEECSTIDLDAVKEYLEQLQESKHVSKGEAKEILTKMTFLAGKDV